MCENCHKHGEGKKWFLQAKNYSDDFLSDVRRQRYIREFTAGQRRLVGAPEPLSRLARLPWPVRPLVNRMIESHMADNHYGQVVSFDEACQILELVNTIVRLPCMCRRITLGGEHRVCFGFSLNPQSVGAAGLVDPDYWEGPDGQGLEQLSRQEALTLLNEYRDKGLVHSVWTFQTPYIGGLCNCDLDGCRAMIGTRRYGLQVLHPGESAAMAADSCKGCGQCALRCPFDAIQPIRSGSPVTIDPQKCYGCGLCLQACPAGTLELQARV